MENSCFFLTSNFTQKMSHDMPSLEDKPDFIVLDREQVQSVLWTVRDSTWTWHDCLRLKANKAWLVVIEIKHGSNGRNWKWLPSISIQALKMMLHWQQQNWFWRWKVLALITHEVTTNHDRNDELSTKLLANFHVSDTVSFFQRKRDVLAIQPCLPEIWRFPRSTRLLQTTLSVRKKNNGDRGRITKRNHKTETTARFFELHYLIKQHRRHKRQWPSKHQQSLYWKCSARKVRLSV